MQHTFWIFLFFMKSTKQASHFSDKAPFTNFTQYRCLLLFLSYSPLFPIVMVMVYGFMIL